MKSSILALVACSLIATMLCAVPPASGFRAGAAMSNITPPSGRPIIGNFVAPLSTNVYDELHAQCLVLDDGEKKLALVVLDLLGTEADTCAQTRSLIEKQLGIPASNVLISAVHTHSACSTGGKAPAPSEPEYENYRAFVVQRIVDGVRCAANRLRLAQLARLTTQAPEHVFNRRWFLKPGAMLANPFGVIDQVKMNPSAVEDVSEADRRGQVQLLRLEPRAEAVDTCRARVV